MREIKFRGKRIDTKEWVYGYLIGKDVIVGEIVEWDSEYFCTEFWWKVDPETVGQYTGVTYKGGAELYDGDIVEIEYYPDLPTTRDYEHLFIRTVCKYGVDASFHLSGIGAVERNTYAVRFSGSAVKRKEIIGNIHDNPELLGGEYHG